MRWWLVGIFERFVFRRMAERSRKSWDEEGKESDNSIALSQAARGLDTPWRVASFLEAHLVEAPRPGLLQVPKPPEKTLAEGEGSGADYARLAQALFSVNGWEAYYVHVYDGQTGALQPFCAVKEPATEAWYQISNVGMFGVYDRLENVLSDVFSNWRLAVVRDDRLAVVKWLEPSGD